MITAQSASDNADTAAKLVSLRNRSGWANRGLNLSNEWVSVLM
jgi:hypothetical protein